MANTNRRCRECVICECGCGNYCDGSCHGETARAGKSREYWCQPPEEDGGTGEDGT